MPFLAGLHLPSAPKSLLSTLLRDWPASWVTVRQLGLLVYSLGLLLEI